MTSCRWIAAYGTNRADTGRAVCGDTDNGFGLLLNWNMLGDGEHTVVAVVDGVELARATVTVTTLGEEFVQGAAGTCEVADFPTPGEAVTAAVAGGPAELCAWHGRGVRRGAPPGPERGRLADGSRVKVETCTRTLLRRARTPPGSTSRRRG